MDKPKNLKERLNIWVKKTNVMVLRSKAAQDRKSVGQVVDDLVEEKIKKGLVKDLVGGLSASETSRK